MNKSLKLTGNVLFLSGTTLFGIMHLSIALFIPHIGDWSDPPGKLVTVLNEIDGWVPYVLSIIFMSIGAIIFIYDIWENIQRKN